MYLTPPGTQGFAPHWDDVEVFMLQLGKCFVFLQRSYFLYRAYHCSLVIRRSHVLIMILSIILGEDTYLTVMCYN